MIAEVGASHLLRNENSGPNCDCKSSTPCTFAWCNVSSYTVTVVKEELTHRKIMSCPTDLQEVILAPHAGENEEQDVSYSPLFSLPLSLSCDLWGCQNSLILCISLSLLVAAAVFIFFTYYLRAFFQWQYPKLHQCTRWFLFSHHSLVREVSSGLGKNSKSDCNVSLVKELCIFHHVSTGQLSSSVYAFLPLLLKCENQEASSFWGFLWGSHTGTIF